jgi:hypothetical protein
LCQAANYLYGLPRKRGLTQGQALQNPAIRVTSVFKKNPVSGLMVDATPGPAITDEMIRDALAGFP